jgi:protease I
MKALIIIDNEFDDLEFIYSFYRLKEEKIEVKVASPNFEVLCGEGGTTISSDLNTQDINPDEYDFLILPGGGAPERIRQDINSINIVKSFDKNKKLICAICHAPQILISAGILKNRMITSNPGIKDDVLLAGAKYVDLEVVFDEYIVTSRYPDDLPFFMRKIIELLNGASLKGNNEQDRLKPRKNEK